MKYDALIITNLPNYYKINLFNQIGDGCKLFVVFIAGSEYRRNSDFLAIRDHTKFQYAVLNDKMEGRSYFTSCWKLFGIIRKNNFRKLILGEWVNIEYWFALLFFSRKKTSMMLESSIHSVTKQGLKEVAKKLFLSRLSTVFANGKKHAELARFLNFSGEIQTTNGLGIINYQESKQEPIRTNKFLYVGRLSIEKNLKVLVEAFNELPFELSILGEGPEKETLEQIAGDNIRFLGYINNTELSAYYKSHRALMLVSTNEPWGLVAEEALFFGTPVIVSSVCGIVDTLCFHGKNSLVVNAESKGEIKKAVNDMLNDTIYEELKNNCSSSLIEEKNKKQVALYVQNILS